jgi:molybdenum cofactor synthesis domain-containing protein
MAYSVAVLIVSDRAASGEREDRCLPAFRSALSGTAFDLVQTAVTSDDPALIRAALRDMLSREPDLLVTCGGTGCGPRDNTPDVTRELLDRPTPGVNDAIRDFSREKSKFAMYSRAASGVVGKTFVLNLPGSPAAVAEILDFILLTIEHPLGLISGRIKDCEQEARSDD